MSIHRGIGRWRGLLLAVAWSAPGLAASAAPSGQDGAAEILGERTIWRLHVAWRRPATVAGGKYDLGGGYSVEKTTRWVRTDFTEPTPPPPAGWMAPDFDDSSWPRRAGLVLGGYGYGDGSPDACLLCIRGRFGVADPATAPPLKLSLSYRGGAAVCLNGTEIARGHLPAGAIQPLTLGEDYPPEAFVGPDGSSLPALQRRPEKPPAELADRYNNRFRSLSVDLPAKLLRKGANVLAVEVHRAAVPAEMLSGSGRELWGTCGLAGLTLRAAAGGVIQANVGPPQGVQVWNCDTYVRPGTDVPYGDPFEPSRPIALAAPRNGVASGQVVISIAAGELKGISATLGELTSDGGARLDGKCIQVRYATADAQFPMLLDKPAEGARIVPIWLTARLPKDAVAGLYRGTLTIAGLDRPATVLVELTVHDWTLPDLRDFGTSVSLLHCPESVAGHYKVPIWSDQHFELLAGSFSLLGYAGNTVLSISAIAQDLFGDHPAIVFRKDGDGYVPDFRFARRYLELYGRHAAPPRQLSIQVWNYSISKRGFGRDGGGGKWLAEKLKIWQLDGDKLIPAEMPIYTAPGTEATWAAVAAGIRRIVQDLGWTRTRLLWGTGGDNLPNEEIIAFFQKIDPGMYWRVATHGGSVSKWGPRPEDRTQTGGLIVGYANLVRRNTQRRQFVEDCPFDVIKRDGVTSTPTDYLGLPPLGRIAANFSGMAFLPFDYWTFPAADGRPRSPLAHYVTFGNITPHCPRAFVMPSPDGPVATPQLEALREGLQITEACLALRAALADPQRSAALGPQAVADAKATIQALVDVLESNRRMQPNGCADLRGLIARLYRLTAQAAR